MASSSRLSQIGIHSEQGLIKLLNTLTINIFGNILQIKSMKIVCTDSF
jgi:hypothetical protein